MCLMVLDSIFLTFAFSRHFATSSTSTATAKIKEPTSEKRPARWFVSSGMRRDSVRKGVKH